MKISWLTFFLFILPISKSQIFDENVTEQNTTMISNHTLERRKLTIFPKSTMKFTVKPHVNSKENIKEDNMNVKEVTRKPLMMKMVPKSKIYTVKTTEPVTRKPFMKIKTYTVKMGSNQNSYEEVKHKEEDKIIKSSTESTDNERSGAVNPNKINNKNKITDILTPPLVISNKKDFFKEEEERDRNEFIFMEKKNENVVNDLPNAQEEFETTTEIQILLRRKRSSNIIEEENTGTTFSALKYTGRDTILTNDIYFKNINH